MANRAQEVLPRSHRPNPFDSGPAGLHGCLWFDGQAGRGPRDPMAEGGWAAIGGSPAFRFIKIKDLPLDVTWWTNLPRAEQWRFGRLRFFKESSFWGPEWSSLLLETEPDGDSVDIPKRVMVWSEIFARAADIFSVGGKKQSKLWSWGDGIACESLRPILWTADPIARLEMDFIFKKTYQEKVFISVDDSSIKNQSRVHLAFPRWSYSNQVLQTLFPAGEWTLVKDWPSPYADRLKWAASQAVPLLIQIDAIHFLPGAEAERYGSLFLGRRAQVFQGSVRDPLWLTQNELNEFKKYAHFEIISAYRAERWEELPALHQMIGLGEDPLSPWSMTAGLVSNAAWLALASPCRDPMSRKKAPISPRALWFRAADRLYCFAAAKALINAGFKVLSYGNGQVEVALESVSKGLVLSGVAPGVGLTFPPRLNAALSTVGPIWDWTGIESDKKTKKMAQPSLETILQVDQWIKKGVSKDWVLNIDRLVWPWPGKGAKEALTEAAQNLLLATGSSPPELKSWWKTLLALQARISVDRLKQRKALEEG